MVLLALIFVRSLAIPDSDCAPMTYATEVALAHPGLASPSKTSETTCSASPPSSVTRNPARTASHPPRRLVTTPKNS